MLTLPFETPLAFSNSGKMNTQEDYPGFMTLDEDITEEDENIVIHW